MRFRIFGSTGLNVSELGVGTWAMSGLDWGDTSKDAGVDAIREMLDHGVNLIDTAPSYGFGASERLVGEAMKGLPRDKALIQTKCGISWPGGVKSKAGSKKDSSRGALMRDIEESLKRLQMDYVDILLIHWPDPLTPFEEVADTLKELKKQGKIRYSGASNFSLEQCQALYDQGVLDVVQYGYSMVDRRAETQLTWCADHGVATESYGTLGAGILGGKYRKLQTFGETESRGRFYQFFKDPQFSQVMQLLNVMDQVSAETERPLNQIALNWNLSKPFLTTALCGVRNPEQADGDCRAATWCLTEEQLEKLNGAIREYLKF